MNLSHRGERGSGPTVWWYLSHRGSLRENFLNDLLKEFFWNLLEELGECFLKGLGKAWRMEAWEAGEKRERTGGGSSGAAEGGGGLSGLFFSFLFFVFWVADGGGFGV